MGGKLSKQQQQIIVLALMFIVGGGYYYINYLINPTIQVIEERESKLKDLNSKIERAQRQAKRLPALEAQYEKLQVELRELEKQLPKDKDVPNIIRVLTREALRENMVFSRLAPKRAVRKQYFEIIPFSVQFRGTLHSLARFLASLGQQDRIFKAENINLRPSGDIPTGGVSLSIQMTIQTYAYRG